MMLPVPPKIKGGTDGFGADRIKRLDEESEWSAMARIAPLVG